MELESLKIEGLTGIKLKGREEHEQSIRVAVEHIEISVLVLYHMLLTEKYHNYYMVYKNRFSAHK